MSGIEFQIMPKNRLAADLNHGVGAILGFLGNARSAPDGKHDCFHVFDGNYFLRIQKDTPKSNEPSDPR